MTREEAIKICTREKGCVQGALDACADGGHYVSPDGIITALDYVEALDMAIAALREQEERSKGCGYCRPPFRTLLTLTIDPETGEEPTTIFFECDGQSLRTYDDNPNNTQIDRANIKFCPMCGRRLEEV